MDTNETPLHDVPPFFRLYSDGRVHRYNHPPFVPPATPTGAGVSAKDIVVSVSTGAAARLYLPQPTDEDQSVKHPLLIYIHGGGFSIESAFSATYHPYVTSLAAEAGAVVVSVEYRLAPEHKIPACYEDSWDVMKWVLSHASGEGTDLDPWLKDRVDFGRVFLAGDSAGANIAHDMAVRVRESSRLNEGVKLVGLALIHPFFGNDEPNEIWKVICQGSDGVNHPKLNPGKSPEKGMRLGCSKVMICVAEEDILKDRGVNYREALKKSGWDGEIVWVETEGENHVFHLINPTSDKAQSFLKTMAFFIRESL